MTVRINPSVLSADFVNMERDLQLIGGADAVHVDIMDNHFVPNLTFGLQMTSRIRDVSPVPLDVHLMISDVDRWAVEYAKLGVESVTFHVEATTQPRAVIDQIHAAGVKAGISVKPGTPIEPYLELVDTVEQVLVMTVEPGFGGQSFMPETMPKVTAVAREAESRRRNIWIQVDGGISASTIQTAAAAGANTFVAGSAVFAGDVSPSRSIAKLRTLASQATHTITEHMGE